MNLPDVILEVAHESPKINKKQRAALETAHENAADHPLLWKAVEHVIVHRYERDTGKKLVNPATFDWSTIKDWLKANLPALIKILLMLLGI